MKKRIAYIDALRGFTMILVVFGHVLSLSFDLKTHDSFVGYLFITFRMPMFFFISGFIAYKLIEKWNLNFYIKNIIKKARVQLIPTIIFFSIMRFIHSTNPLESFCTNGPGAYWFTIVLFEFFLLYFSTNFLVKKMGGGKNTLTLFLVIESILLFIWLIGFRMNSKLWVVLSLENVTKYYQFFSLGIIFRMHYPIIKKFLCADKCITILLVSFVAMYILKWNETIKANFLVSNAINDVFIRYTGLLLVFSLFIMNESFFETNNPVANRLKYIGRRTLDIYLLHFFFIPNLGAWKYLFEANDKPIIEFFVYALITGMIIAACLAVRSIIRHSKFLGYWLFGVKVDTDSHNS